MQTIRAYKVPGFRGKVFAASAFEAKTKFQAMGVSVSGNPVLATGGADEFRRAEKPGTTAKAVAPASKPAADKKPTVIHRADYGNVTPAKVASSAPAPAPAGPKLTTAAAFATPALTMARSEFEKLGFTDKNRFFREGGKLVEDPENVMAAFKARAEAAGVAKSPDLSHLKGVEKYSASLAFTMKRDKFLKEEAARMIHDEDLAAQGSGNWTGPKGNNRVAASIARDARIAARAKDLAARLPL